MQVDPESYFDAEQPVQLVARGPEHVLHDELHAKHAGALALPVS